METENARIALCALALHLPQDQVTNFLAECRRSFAFLPMDEVAFRNGHNGAPHSQDQMTVGRETWVTLVVDEWEGLYDLSRLATHVDVLSFAWQRRGFGAARSTAVQEARIADARWSVIVDADGQHDPLAIGRVLREAEASQWAAAIPQRTVVDLPLLEVGDHNRKLAERFETYFVAKSCGRSELVRGDLQPGIFVLGQNALDLLCERVKTRAYSWDLEASYHLLTSGLPIGFPTIESRPQASSFFAVEDSYRILRYLASLGGSAAVREVFALFCGEAWIGAEFSAEELNTFARQLELALA